MSLDYDKVELYSVGGAERDPYRLTSFADMSYIGRCSKCARERLLKTPYTQPMY